MRQGRRAYPARSVPTPCDATGSQLRDSTPWTTDESLLLSNARRITSDVKNVRKSNTPDYPLGDPKVDLFSFEPGSPRTTAEFTLEGDEVVLYRWQIGSPPMEIERLPLSAWLADIDFAAAKEDNEFDEDLDPPPVDEAFLLLELDWRVSCVSTASGITISTTPQDDGSVDQDNHWRSFGLEPGSSIQEQWIRSAASAEKWIRNSKSTGVIDRYGNFSEVDTEHLNILKFLLAAEWTSSSFSSDRAGWHSTNNPPARSFLTADFLAARDTNDLDIVRSRIEAVESFTRRHGMIGPLRSVRVATEYLEETGQPTIGYYLVALKNFGEELRGFFVRPDRTAAKLSTRQAQKYRLRYFERALIHDAQPSSPKLFALNFREMAHPVTEYGGFTAAIAPNDVDSWFSNPVAANIADKHQLKPLETHNYSGSESKFYRLARMQCADAVIGTLHDYLTRCVPFPTRTELVSWSLSCLPGGQGDNRRSSTGVLACLSIAMTAVLTLLKDPRSDRSAGTSSLATWSWVRMTTFGSFGYSDATRGPTSSLLTTASSARESA